MEKFILLRLKCPFCKKSLMDPYHTIHQRPSLALDIEAEGERGKVYLCAFYGCYDHDSSIPVPDRSISRFFCPHCHEELISEHRCKACEAPMIPLSMEKGGRIYFCARRGCTQHYLDFQNVSDALRKMYGEYGYF